MTEHDEVVILRGTGHPDATARLLAIREAAYQRGDAALAGEVEADLVRKGVEFDEWKPAVDAAPEPERAVVKRSTRDK